MSAQQDQLARAYEAFNDRDLPGIRALLHPEGVWPNTLESGEVEGMEAIMAHFAHVFAITRPNIQLIRVVEETEGRLSVEAQYLVEDTQGHIWSDTRASLIYHFRDGLLSGMTILDGL
jgi:hypothetical protein